MNDIKLYAKNEKELETLILAVKIYSQNIEMELGKKNVPRTLYGQNGITKSRQN